MGDKATARKGFPKFSKRPEEKHAEPGKLRSQHFKVPKDPGFVFDVYYDCKTHAPDPIHDVHDLYRDDPVMDDYSIYIHELWEDCKCPPGSISQPGTKKSWVITVTYTVKNDEGVKYTYTNVEVDKIECDCECGGQRR
jgi:hypothetical protein